MKGPEININVLTKFILGDSFLKSLTASEMGCDTPLRIILLGPLRKCINPITLRSINVKNATLSKTPAIDSNEDIIKIMGKREEKFNLYSLFLTVR